MHSSQLPVCNGSGDRKCDSTPVVFPSDVKPSWEAVPFGEMMSDIPSVGSGYRDNNPLDMDVVLHYDPRNSREHVYYHPRTGEVKVSARDLYFSDLSALFGAKVSGIEHMKDASGRHVRSFLYEMVIGDSLVYRCFDRIVSCRRTKEQGYVFLDLPPKEICRYVFCSYGLIKEDRDHTRILTSVEKIMSGEFYDTLKDTDKRTQQDLICAFNRCVRIPHKKEISKALRHVDKDFHCLCFKVFSDIYRRAVHESRIAEDVPERIIRELSRNLCPNAAVRIDRDLVVISGEERVGYYLDFCVETRAYFDSRRGYCFVRNAVTGAWDSDDLYGRFLSYPSTRTRTLDSDIFDRTCMESFAAWSIDKAFPRDNKVLFGVLLAEAGYLCAEQAAKMNKPLFRLILKEIYEGRLTDGTISLADYLGITGPQIKFLEDIDLPYSLDGFGACMKAADFMAAFPDVKKRIFAVSFYLSGDKWGGSRKLTREEVFSAAATLNSLERTDREKRSYILSLYRDYLLMHRRYRRYMDERHENTSVHREILAFGDMPVNIRPSRIKSLHEKMCSILDIIDSAEKIKKYSAAIEERYAKEGQAREYRNDGYIIRMPVNAAEIIREGRFLHHCVGQAGYIESMAEGGCVILFLRSLKDPEVPFYTLEERNGSIRQCYGLRNDLNHSIEIRDLIMEYADKHGLGISARIYSAA